jgi:predicted DNA-binding mobile mystery protein A
MENNLRIKQIDKKLEQNNRLLKGAPANGWIRDVRTSLNMSAEQLGKRLNIGAEGVKKMEQRERNKNITLKNLDEAARAFGLRLTYGFSAPQDNLEQLVAAKAKGKAKTVVARTNRTMSLEKQANSKARLQRSVKELAGELARKKPKYLWD